MLDWCQLETIGFEEGDCDTGSVEVLQLVVLGHVVAEGVSEVLDEGGASELADEALGVLDQLLFFDALVNVEVVDGLLEVVDEFEAFFAFELFVVG